jgi:uncharacterized SAM-binding protein YcdF (DUF218 family)
MGLVMLCVIAGLAFTPLADVLSVAISVSTRLEPADAIVVLGAAGVRRDGTLSDSSLRRAMRGIDLYRRGLASTLVFTGPRNLSGYAEGEVRATLAMDLGVPRTAILVDTTARTTQEEGHRVAALLAPRAMRRILLVSDAEGMRRATGVFERVGFDVLPAPTAEPMVSERTPGARLVVARLVATELVALAYYHLAGYF